MASRSIAEKEIKILWGLAAGRCAFPGCRQICAVDATPSDPAVPVGEMAHIVAHSDTGPRADPTFPPGRRAYYENLLLLCPTHHTQVDKQPNSFTTADLSSWKREHEQWVRTRLAEEIVIVGFAELEMVSQALLAGHGDPTQDLTILSPIEKMSRNDLTAKVLDYLRMGIAASGEVRSFVEAVSQLVPGFPDRLKAGFIQIYRECQSQGYHGDGLFLAILERVGGTGSDFRRGAAGLAVQGYLFLTCEIFER